jgi:antitoxin (DNA-binding transcriptional repressor) of toxin-antitoxin stability system
MGVAGSSSDSGKLRPRELQRHQLEVKVLVMLKSKTVTMLELREDAARIVSAVRRGQRMVLTYRGRPAMRLEPIGSRSTSDDDAFYRLADLADHRGDPLTNEEIDRIVYGS